MACLAVAAAASGAENRYDGVYAGKRSLVKGPALVCPDEENVSLIIRGDTLSFTDSQAHGTIPFDFTGSFYLSGLNKYEETMTIYGRIVGDTLDVDVTNPPCEHHWHLKKQ
jgi:hypothetical protein